MTGDDDRRAAARIEAALAAHGDDLEPPPGWQARVLAEIAPRRRWWRFAVPAVVAAVVLAIVLWPRTPRVMTRPTVSLAYELARGARPMMRGTSAAIGDTITATTGGEAAHHALWIYRDDSLVLACPGLEPACRATPNALIASLTISGLGSYAIVALASNAPIPPPAGGRDLAIVKAADAGAAWRMEQVEAR